MEASPPRPTRSLAPAWRVGVVAGVVLGIIAILNHTLEIFAALSPLWSAVRGIGMWVLTFLAFSLASARVSSGLATLHLGLVAAIVTATVNLLLLIPYAVLAGILASQPLTASLVFEIGVTHLVQSVIIAIFVGGVGCGIASGLRRLPAWATFIVSAGAVLLFAAGLASIVHASALERSERPPFILLGLPAVALALAAVGPLWFHARARSGNTAA